MVTIACEFEPPFFFFFFFFWSDVFLMVTIACEFEPPFFFFFFFFFVLRAVSSFQACFSRNGQNALNKFVLQARGMFLSH